MKILKNLAFMAFMTMLANTAFAQTQAVNITDLDDLEISYEATGNSITLPDGTVTYEMAFASSKKVVITTFEAKCKGRRGCCAKGMMYVTSDGDIHVISVDDMGNGAISNAELYYQSVGGEIEETYE